MKTIKIIDLLNKIANGEEVPSIKYMDKILHWNKEKDRFEDKDGMNTLYEMDFSELNYEVEILEKKQETKQITKKDFEALGYACGEIQKAFTNGWTKSLKNKSLKEKKKIPEKIKSYYDVEIQENCIYEEGNKKDNAILGEPNSWGLIIDKINEILDYLETKGE